MTKYEKTIVYVLLPLLIAVIVVICLMCAVPPVSRDALTHHLAVPKIWIRQGGMVELPSIAFSYYPMNLDLLFVVPLYFGNDILPKYIHFLFALGTAGLIFNYLRNRLGAGYGLLGALFFLTVPIIVKLSISAYVDLGLIFFSAAALFSLLKWVEKKNAFRYLLLASACCGMALGTKYNGLISLLLFSFMTPVLYLRGGHREGSDRASLKCQLKALGAGLVFVSVSLMFFSPWMVRNYLLTENPVYPLYNNRFNPQPPADSDGHGKAIGSADSGGEQKDSGPWSHFAVRKYVHGETFWQTATIPLRVFFEGRDDDPKYFDGQLTPFLLLLAVVALFPGYPDASNTRIEINVLAAYAFLYLVLVFFQIDMRIRWISPIVPPMVVLSVYGVHRLQNIIQTKTVGKFFARTGVVALSAAILLVNASYMASLYQKVDPVPYLTGKIDRDTYIRKFRPEYEVIRFANHTLPDSTVILALFLGNRRYYFEHKVMMEPVVLKDALAASNTAGQVSAHLHEIGVRSIIIRDDLFDFWRQNSLDPKAQRLLTAFMSSQAKELRSYGGYRLFAF